MTEQSLPIESPFGVKSSDILPSSPARQKRTGEIVETGAGDLIQNRTVCPWEMDREIRGKALLCTR